MSDQSPGVEPPPPPAAPRRRPVPGTFLGIDNRDFGLLGCGAFAAVGSLGAYYTVTLEGTGARASFSAWHGLLSGLGVVLAVAASGVLAAGLLGPARTAAVRPVVLVLFVAAAACTLASYVVTPGQLCDDLVYLDHGCDGAVVGRGDGFWRTLLGTGGGAFVTLYWRVVGRREHPAVHDSSGQGGRW